MGEQPSSELKTEEGGQRRLLIVKSPRATVNAGVVGVEAGLPVGGIVSHAARVVGGARDA